jgi:hypothetical protein
VFGYESVAQALAHPIGIEAAESLEIRPQRHGA